MEPNLAAPITFAEAVKVMNNTWLWEAKLTWETESQFELVKQKFPN